jgi:hypothetical protein
MWLVSARSRGRPVLPVLVLLLLLMLLLLLLLLELLLLLKLGCGAAGGRLSGRVLLLFLRVGRV